MSHHQTYFAISAMPAGMALVRAGVGIDHGISCHTFRLASRSTLRPRPCVGILASIFL